MDLNKHITFFNPVIKDEVHIIGCGAIGSNVALQLAKLGVSNIYLWDYDKVDSHNITNQIYNQNDIGKLKTDALEEHMKLQNPDIVVKKKSKYTNETLKGIVFLCVDSIETRYKIYVLNQFNMMIKLIIDGRMGLKTGQIYATDWANSKQIENIINLSDFKDEDAAVDFSPCGTTLSVSPTVLIIISIMIASMINYVNNEKYNNIVYINAFENKITKV